MSASIWDGNASVTGTVNADNTYSFDRIIALTQGQKIFVISAFAYAPNTGSLDVRINGVGQAPGIDYIESDSNSITILEGCDIDDIIDVRGLTGSTGAANSAVSAAIAEDAAARAEIAADLVVGIANTFIDTSVTEVTIGLGVKVFTVAAGKQFIAGQFVMATANPAIANYMVGQVTSYVGTQLTLSVSKFEGFGPFSNWNLSVTGVPQPVPIIPPVTIFEDQDMLTQAVAISLYF